MSSELNRSCRAGRDLSLLDRRCAPERVPVGIGIRIGEPQRKFKTAAVFAGAVEFGNIHIIRKPDAAVVSADKQLGHNSINDIGNTYVHTGSQGNL